MNLRLRSLFFALMYCTVALSLRAQKTEFGILAGGSYYYGDIVNYSFEPQTVGPSLGVFLRYHLNTKMTLRANLQYCRVQGADSSLALQPESKWQKARNLAFYSDIIEVSGMFEYNLIADASKGNRRMSRCVPYILGGVGLFYFEPMAIHPLTRKSISLRKLQLEGTSYLPVAIAFPLGGGMRFYVTRKWQIGMELGMRFTSTSHLDDITGNSTYQDPANLPNDNARIMSVRNLNSIDTETQMAGNFAGKPRGKISYINDLYVIGGITLSYRLGPNGASGIGGKASRCPRFY